MVISRGKANMNEFMKQTFNYCRELNGELEEVMQTFGDGCAFCKVSVRDGGYDFLINIELNEFDKHQYKANDQIKFKLALMHTWYGELYKDENEFFKCTNGKAAPESFVPHMYYDDNGAHEDSSAFVCGKVISVENIEIDNVQCSHVTIRCLGCALDLFYTTAGLPEIRQGNIIGGRYDVIGWAT